MVAMKMSNLRLYVTCFDRGEMLVGNLAFDLICVDTFHNTRSLMCNYSSATEICIQEHFVTLCLLLIEAVGAFICSFESFPVV